MMSSGAMLFKHATSWLQLENVITGSAEHVSRRIVQVGLFEAAARAAPGDADAHVALGVLHNLGRAYEPAVASFRSAHMSWPLP